MSIGVTLVLLSIGFEVTNNYKVFVANRVVKIQGLTRQEEWRHVGTKSNPADMLSRGMDPRELPYSEIWWSGPSWLQASPDQWPQEFIMERQDGLEERSRERVLVTMHEEGCNLFVENAGKSTQRSSGPLKVEELRRANIALIKIVQRQAYSQEIEELSKEGNFKSVARSSRILALNPFLDEQGILRVGGRLKNAELSYDQRFPIILPSDSPFSTLLIREKHYQYLHAELNTLSAIIRENYWIVSARRKIRGVLRRCILCFRKSPKNISQLMGNLPAVRVNPGRPFNHTGIDYAGPFTIKISRNKSGKAYLAVFVCLATKAVHLEVVSDLSTVAFINTLKRFVARRGKSSHLYSDNGRNFIGARNELNEWVRFIQSEQLKNEVLEFTAEQSIRWKFIPPYSPHVGGIWESAVKAAKSHMKAVMNQNSLTFEELTTIFTQIEAILNSRPITPVSTDPSDLSALTPGHFLVGAPLTAIPEPNIEQIHLNRLSRFQLLSSIIQGFWKRWSREYVSNLQVRQKWKERKENPNLKIGALVLLRDDNAPPLQWRLGRITELIKGQDGLVRMVELKTQLGLTQRAIQRISVLPLE
ncbi:PREDICTED: uncharacterized protein LOC108767569 [Trachymyrmex cornetzi]|uniref:uncharacterized protein LOC108767569 n=1 Tax=Trachymyrmex cornetzi TaxID=471704 RepID=UPI00084ED2D1|nr:PREDICTED: uncharacterized protein LOC108767569 [Trachymyrmex cornetzi]